MKTNYFILFIVGFVIGTVIHMVESSVNHSHVEHQLQNIRVEK